MLSEEILGIKERNTQLLNLCKCLIYPSFHLYIYIYICVCVCVCVCVCEAPYSDPHGVRFEPAGFLRNYFVNEFFSYQNDSNFRKADTE